MLIQLSKFGKFLSTRDIGKIIKSEITSILDGNNNVIVDFEGISQITQSCADEIFGKLVLEIGLSKFKKCIKIKNTDEVTSVIIKYTISKRLTNGSI